jgi:hypothetical protein
MQHGQLSLEEAGAWRAERFGHWWERVDRGQALSPCRCEVDVEPTWESGPSLLSLQ